MRKFISSSGLLPSNSSELSTYSAPVPPFLRNSRETWLVDYVILIALQRLDIMALKGCPPPTSHRGRDSDLFVSSIVIYKSLNHFWSRGSIPKRSRTGSPSARTARAVERASSRTIRCDTYLMDNSISRCR